MCVGTCARILGPCLLTLGLLSVVANTLLLFPSWEWRYLQMGHITKKAMLMPGVWGGGLLMFLSIVLSGLALLGSAACFVLSGVGLTEGPLCFYSSTTHNGTQMTQWDYPFLQTHSQTRNYLYDPPLWNKVCIEPRNIVSWNVYFFSALLIISTVEMVLAVLQIINGFFGCFCGSCEKK
uniref:Transmembrane 4 L six family member 19 n=1 Tax=Podarcis muralis TaxID=64176 RepID=A0A670JF36_PODMU